MKMHNKIRLVPLILFFLSLSVAAENDVDENDYTDTPKILIDLNIIFVTSVITSEIPRVSGAFMAIAPHVYATAAPDNLDFKHTFGKWSVSAFGAYSYLELGKDKYSKRDRFKAHFLALLWFKNYNRLIEYFDTPDDTDIHISPLEDGAVFSFNQKF